VQGDGSVLIEYRARLPADTTAPGAARRLVRCLTDTVGPDALENLELLVTELVTNAVRHAGLDDHGWIAVELAAGRSTVHVEVCDPGRGFDERDSTTVAGQERGSGWGLFLVDQMASQWGVRHDDCTRVWFDLPVERRASFVT
jgi:anti-sigma regulatory factor (Ser/Thr protein kinase)